MCVGAFSDKRIAKVKVLTGPGLCTSMGPREVTRLVSVSRGGPGRGGILSSCAQLPPSQGRLPLVTRRLVETAHRLGVQVHVWTVNDPAEMERLLDLGVDGIVSDHPARAVQLCRARMRA